MAKSNGFWGKRRGSAGSLTFSVLNGKQVTKEKVTSVRNPKTQYQARQRMITSLATKFAAALRGIVDHSFQNIAYGEKSVQHFLSMAMKFKEGYFFSIAKGGYGFQPANFVISEGTLGTLGVKDISDDTGELVNIVKNAADYANFLESNPNFKDGDQITVVGIVNTKEHYEEDENLLGFASRDNYTLIDRIVLNDANCANIEEIQTENAGYEINLRTGVIEKIGTTGALAGMAVILSRRDDVNGKWLRSTETMTIAMVNGLASFRQYQADLATFMPAAASMNSDRYLNQAERAADASTIYTEAVQLVIQSTTKVAPDDLLILGVKDSGGVYHAVVSGLLALSYKSEADDVRKAIPAFSATTEPASSVAAGTSWKPCSPKLNWNTEDQDAVVGSTVTLGEPVNYVDVANFLFAQ